MGFYRTPEGESALKSMVNFRSRINRHKYTNMKFWYRGYRVQYADIAGTNTKKAGECIGHKIKEDKVGEQGMGNF